MKDRILRRAVLAFCVVSIGGFFVAFGDGERVAAGSVERTLAPVDAITDAIRSKGSRIVVVDRGSFAEAGLANEARLIDRFGSLSEYVTSGLDRGSDAGLKTSVNLPFGSFDPILSPPAGTIHRDSVVSAGPDYYVVQFGGLVKGDWIDDLESFGVRVLQYVPHQAYLVYADGEAIRKAADHYRVRWVGRYLEESRLPEILRSQVSAARGLSGLAPTISPLSIDDNGMALIDMAIFARADARRIAADLPASLDAKVLNVIELPNNYFNVIRCEVPLSRIEEIANIRDVVRVDFYSRPEPEDERAAQIVAGNYSNTTTLNGPGYNPLTQFGVDGTNVTISMVDDGVSIPGVGGFYISASNTVNGPLRGAAAGATGGHGHLNASIISGAAPFGSLDALNYNYGLGVAPKSNIINIPLLVSGYSGSEANSYDDTVTTSGVNGAKGYISNNSWGNGTNSNVYDSYTAQFDGFVRDASSAATIDPISLVFSAGNSGPAALSLTRPKAAKNLIAVANSENIRTELGSTNADNMDDLRSSSSRGPTGDNRIKPDITAPGSYVTGGRAGNCSSVTSCFDANHAYSIGTSHAAPQVAGAAALFTQFWRNNNVGQNPSPAIIKAAVINTGQDMGGSNVTAPVPNGAEGWGRMNMKLMFPTAVPVKYVDQSAPFFDPGDSVTYTGTVASASQPFRVTLVWTDPPAAAQPALVNNLNLTVTVGGNVYRGNVFSNGSSTTGGTSDSIDNVENVFLPAGIAAGTQVTIQVTAAALNGDGILGNADSTDQHFALVGYNFQQQAAPVSKAVSDFDGDGKSDVAVWRESNGVWYWLNSSNNTFNAVQFGTVGDKITPGDYDGDGKTDQAVYRPSLGVWYILRSTQGFTAVGFGLPTDLPAQGDFDGDGKTDVSVWRPDSGTWFRLNSSNGAFSATQFGTTGDKPVAADFDGDGKTDQAVYRPSNGVWYWLRSTNGQLGFQQFGITTDKVAPGDFDGDGKADQAVFRDGTWFVQRSTAGFMAVNFGSTGDIAAPADFDGDGKADIDVYRPSNGVWYRLNSSNGAFNATQFGTTGDVPVPAGYVPVQ